MARWAPVPRAKPQGPYLPGRTVSLNDAYGTVTVGALVANGPVSGDYATYTLRLPDGSLFRSEGRLS